MFRSPSRSPFRLNSRTADTSFFRCFFDVFNLRAGLGVVWRAFTLLLLLLLITKYEKYIVLIIKDIFCLRLEALKRFVTI